MPLLTNSRVSVVLLVHVPGASAACAALSAAAAAKVATGFVGSRVGYRVGRRLDRVEVAHVRQYLQDMQDAAAAGMRPEACVEYASMCDAGPFSPEVAAAVGRQPVRPGEITKAAADACRCRRGSERGRRKAEPNSSAANGGSRNINTTGEGHA
ncbi:hypothetical protein VOLCADRAFT_92997 [Volvox carteri f. nagariensis]|uniref:Uncharacterized protein n=1 Tax=Volvox carteri f. nagariensis TaxID=3068 RepID=D8U123_VOLCA|nr:uncharacterized protein VOLCADRAFT_92997 [Volvox carteri f. nagariensis]EFJ46557.1 hypothetical protein VOLCADRAFT_92997 [Volvox carteri f. nagariensis]|eukprot:XP_002952414.1 hypothetical protein VOLCADRAFT_92997 [Volvox carteri f. nagariensis]